MMNLPKSSLLLMLAGLGLAGTSGFLASEAFGLQGSQTPSTTTTISLTNGGSGPTGPVGPVGPTGPAGIVDCPAGSVFGLLTINHPGGHVSIYTCIVKDGK